MSDTTNQPVIFLAFANDRGDTVDYLRNLPDEARRLRDALESAEQAGGLCGVVVRSNSTVGDIFKVFQDPKYRNRIAIFHYGGHANGYQLLLESPEGKAAAADAGGLAAFLAEQQGLQLVFLNGCSTQKQTQELHDANIAVVISTSRSIDDKVDTDFADFFYQGLAGGVTLRKASSEACGAINMTKGGDLRVFCFGDADELYDQRNESRCADRSVLVTRESGGGIVLSKEAEPDNSISMPKLAAKGGNPLRTTETTSDVPAPMLSQD